MAKRTLPPEPPAESYSFDRPARVLEFCTVAGNDPVDFHALEHLVGLLRCNPHAIAFSQECRKEHARLLSIVVPQDEVSRQLEEARAKRCRLRMFSAPTVEEAERKVERLLALNAEVHRLEALHSTNRVNEGYLRALENFAPALFGLPPTSYCPAFIGPHLTNWAQRHGLTIGDAQYGFLDSVQAVQPARKRLRVTTSSGPLLSEFRVPAPTT